MTHASALLRIASAPFALIGLSVLFGCSAATTATSAASSTSPTAASIYVIEGGSPTVLQFAANSTGSVSPSSSLTTSLVAAHAIAVDASGQIYVGGDLVGLNRDVVLIYPAGSSGAATPIRTIDLLESNITFARSLAVDTAGNLYVGGNGVAVYAPTANGVATPIRQIAGAATQIAGLQDIAIDASGNLFVANGVVASTTTTNGVVTTTPASGSIVEFSSTANGNVAPSFVIPGSNPFWGVTVDASGNVYATQNAGTTVLTLGSIFEFAPGATTPSRTISGTATNFYGFGGIFVDSNGYLYVDSVSEANNTITAAVEQFAPGSNGNVAPSAQLTSSSWTLSWQQFAVK